MVTIDAMGNQRKIAQKIIDREGDYLTGLKDNQLTILEENEAPFNSIGHESSYTEHDKGYRPDVALPFIQQNLNRISMNFATYMNL
jgi:predicted transposase YbfD/YdcC